ncbi:otolith matrix protein OMM-64-like [Triticum dicoccoides]|uniref:otolith matrix protein OMM-64-like n=1 Tax=Triticum dicoccoides TaxID=85692 RepID=UPI00188E9788|nr:otolith matrix protein OMM-64-like [Triticum dicoccoides]
MSSRCAINRAMAGDPGRMLVRGCTAHKMDMDGGSKYRSRGHTMGSNNYKRLPYLLLLLLAVGAATLSVSVLHKMRERRLLSVLLQEREQQLMSLQVRLENEKGISKEMRRKVDELEAKTSILSIERTELKNKVMNSETTTTYLTNTQKELEAALVEQESHINQMKEIVAASGPDQMSAIKELLQQKEAELEEIKTKFSGNAVLATNNEDATSDTVAPENSASSGDTIPDPTEDHSYNTTASESNHQDERILESTNNKDVNPDAVIPEEKINSSDSMPATGEELHSDDTTASESNHQDERTVVGTNNEDVVTPDTVIGEEKANSSGSTPDQAEELQSYNTTASESNHQEDGSSEGQFVKFTTNFEDDALQEKTDDANQSSDDPPPKGTHSEESELRQSADSQEISKEEVDGRKQLEDTQGEVSYHSRESKLLEKEDGKEVAREPEKEMNPDGEMKISKDSQEISKEELDGKKQLEDPQGEVSYHSKESKLLEKEDGNEVAREAEKEISPDGEIKISKDSQEISKEELDGKKQLEDPQGDHSTESKLLEQEDGKEVASEPEKKINPDGEMKISKDSLAEANQEIMQVVEPVASPADANLSLSTNNRESKETSKRHRKRKSRSKRRKRTDVAASNVDGEVIKGR